MRPVQLCRVGGIDHPHSDFLWRALALWVRFFWSVNRSHQSLCHSVISPSDLKAIFLFHQSFCQYRFPYLTLSLLDTHHCLDHATNHSPGQLHVFDGVVRVSFKEGKFSPKVRSHSSIHLLGEQLKGVVYLCQHHLNCSVYESCLVNNVVTQ
jgi:hypothetical protein